MIRDKKLSAARQRQTLEELTTNYYATNLELGLIPPLFLYQLGRSRWRIDTEALQTLTVDCHLKHAAAHRPTALPIWTVIRVLAHTLSLLFYHRQLLSHAGQGTPASFREFTRTPCQLASALDSSSAPSDPPGRCRLCVAWDHRPDGSAASRVGGPFPS